MATAIDRPSQQEKSSPTTLVEMRNAASDEAHSRHHYIALLDAQGEIIFTEFDLLALARFTNWGKTLLDTVKCDPRVASRPFKIPDAGTMTPDSLAVKRLLEWMAENKNHPFNSKLPAIIDEAQEKYTTDSIIAIHSFATAVGFQHPDISTKVLEQRILADISDLLIGSNLSANIINLVVGLHPTHGSLVRRFVDKVTKYATRKADAADAIKRTIDKAAKVDPSVRGLFEEALKLPDQKALLNERLSKDLTASGVTVSFASQSSLLGEAAALQRAAKGGERKTRPSSRQATGATANRFAVLSTM